MQTVTFQCGHCGNLMAVTADMVGQQVRCPHCQQIVMAPVTASPPPPPPTIPTPAAEPEPAFNFSTIEERESIFTPDEQVSEDVFGAVPRPVFEVPPSAPVPSVEPANPFAFSAAESHTPPEPANPFHTFAPPPASLPSEPAPASTSPAAWPESQPASPWSNAEPERSDLEARAEFNDPAPARIATPRADKGWMIVAFIIPLISYSILMTILAIIFYYRMAAIPHPFEALPDTDGENKGAARRQSMVDRVKPDNPLPANLRVGLNQSIRVGDLQITPLRVEKTNIRYRNQNGTLDPARESSLVLHLQMTNVSDGVTFRPIDPYFLRAWNSTRGISGMPYTFLEMGATRFYGGPINWGSDGRGGYRADIEIEGHHPHQELRPGASMNTLVCTHPDQRAADQVKDYQGRLLWRVQVRRGLVQAKHREVSATAVIGVEFAKADIH